MSAPKIAPSETRLIILDALMDPGRRFLDQISSSRNWLDRWDLTEAGFFAELCDDLRSHEIFLKPKNKPADPQKYQTRLIYAAEPPDYPEQLNIHITLSPKGDPPQVKVAIHPSDTARELPKISIKTKPTKS
jgi:hypothetical protein